MNGGILRYFFPLSLIAILAILPIMTLPSFATGVVQSNSLSDHWLPQRGCYRDELNKSDADYSNCWMDNAGKILVASSLTNDSVDASRSLSFIQSNFNNSQMSSGDYYLPELWTNSTISQFSSATSQISISNRMIELTGDNDSSSHFDQLAIGTSYTGNLNLAYLGADRIWFDNGTTSSAYSSVSSNVFRIPNGFSKRSLFNVGGQDFYTFTNTTLAASEPYANVNVQLEALNNTSSDVKYVFLQAFNATDTNPFFSAALYSRSGSFIQNIPFRGSGGTTASGMILAYSNATNVFTNINGSQITGQDAVAIRYGSSQIYDWEHWANDAPFGASWFGPGYLVQPNVTSGTLSSPIASEVYPVQHFDYRLANDTAKYLTNANPGFEVSPPVSFGFISFGLALEALSTHNSTLLDLAKGYWNYYYARYQGSVYSTEYAGSVNLLLLAGFKIYGCNSTVENFARAFLENSPASSIEEFGWGSAAAFQLQSCTGSDSDHVLYERYIDAFSLSNESYVGVKSGGNYPRSVSVANYTYQYGEAASGLMLAGTPFNDSIVLSLMNAVYQSNASGIVLNQPFPSSDLANTETLPAYLLATSLFQTRMLSSTGYDITGLGRVNITSIQILKGNLVIDAIGSDGYILLSHLGSFENISVSGFQTMKRPVIVSTSASSTTSGGSASSQTSSIVTTDSTSSVATVSSTVNTSSPPCTKSSHCHVGSLSIFFGAILTIIVGVIVVLVLFMIRRKKVESSATH
jgi:hypothetical protein